MKWLSSLHCSYTSLSCLSLLAGLWHCCLFLFSVSFYSSHMDLCCCPGMAGMPLTCFTRHYAETLWLKLLFWQKNLHLSWSHAKRDVHACFAVHHSNAVVGDWERGCHCSMPVHPLPSEPQTVAGGKGCSSSLVTIKCGIFTPASTAVTG